MGRPHMVIEYHSYISLMVSVYFTDGDRLRSNIAHVELHHFERNSSTLLVVRVDLYLFGCGGGGAWAILEKNIERYMA